MGRLTRAEQAGRNRVLVLDAARRVFLARGYHNATLEQIADEAGFSKGVVYSQFASKADLFLALLDARIAERAEENARLAESLPGDDQGLLALVGHLTVGDQLTRGWQLLVIEFRVHAARDAELSRRYATAHARTIEALAGVLAAISARSGQEPAMELRQLAELMLTLSVGVSLEQTASPGARGGRGAAQPVARGRPPRVWPRTRAAGGESP